MKRFIDLSSILNSRHMRIEDFIVFEIVLNSITKDEFECVEIIDKKIYKVKKQILTDFYFHGLLDSKQVYRTKQVLGWSDCSEFLSFIDYEFDYDSIMDYHIPEDIVLSLYNITGPLDKLKKSKNVIYSLNEFGEWMNCDGNPLVLTRQTDMIDFSEIDYGIRKILKDHSNYCLTITNSSVYCLDHLFSALDGSITNIIVDVGTNMDSIRRKMDMEKNNVFLLSNIDIYSYQYLFMHSKKTFIHADEIMECHINHTWRLAI